MLPKDDWELAQPLLTVGKGIDPIADTQRLWEENSFEWHSHEEVCRRAPINGCKRNLKSETWCRPFAK